MSDLIRGNQLLRSGKFEEAVDAYQKAIACHPKFHWNYHKLGEALERLGRREEARAAFCKALDLKLSSETIRNKLETEPNKKIIIHIGTGKTASTAIQSALTSSFSKGNLNGICYPLPLPGYSHQQIAHLYYQNHTELPRSRYSLKSFKDLKRDYKTNLFQQIKNNTKVILSSEFFSGFEIGQIQELRCDLDNMGAVEYEIILYIREPASYYLSFVQQQIKASSKFTPPTKFRYPFLKFITSWSKVFLREQLNIRIFNPEMFPEGSVLLDFQNCVEKFFKQKIELDSTSRDNESISAEGMIVLQKYREFIYPHEDNVFKGDSNILIKLLQKSKDKVLQTQPKLLPKVTAYIRQRHQKDVNALKNIYGVNLEGLESLYQKNSESSGSIDLGDSIIDGSCIEKVLEDFDRNVLIDLLLWIVNFQLNQKS